MVYIYMTYVLGPPSAEVYGSDFRSVPLVAELGERLAAWQTLVLVDGNTK